MTVTVATKPQAAIGAAGPELVVIDRAVADLDAVRRAALARGAEVAVLEPGRDGLAQIADRMAGRRGVAALHLVGHGRAGAILLAGSEIDMAMAGRRARTLARIGAALAPGGSLLLYGCDVAATPAGRAFVARLAALTGTAVAAATGPTGDTARGGDWALAHRVGRIATTPLQVPAMRGTLATFTVTSLNDSGAGSLRQAVADASIGGADTIVFQNLSGTITLEDPLSVPDRTSFTFGGTTTALTIGGAAITGSRMFVQSGEGHTLTINSDIDIASDDPLVLREGHVVIGGDVNSVAFELDGGNLEFVGDHTLIYLINVNSVGEVTVSDGSLTLPGFYGGGLFEQGTAYLTKSGPGTIFFTGTEVLYSKFVYINEGFISISERSNYQGFSAYLTTLNGGGLEITGETTLTYGLSIGANGGTISTTADAVLTGVLSGGGSLTKTGSAVLSLTGANTYTGTTTVSTGTLSVAGDGNLGAGAVTLDGGALAITGATDIDNDVAVGASGGTISLAADATFSGALTGAGTLTKTGDGILTLTGASTHGGATVVSAGTLRLSGEAALSATGTVTVEAGATLDLGGADVTLGALTGAGTVVVGDGSITLSDPGASSFSGTLSSAGGFTVAAGVTLGGTGTYTSAVTVTSGAVISPGNSPGILSTGDLTLAAGSTATMELDGAGAGTGYDQIGVTGTVTIADATLNAVLGYAPAAGDSYLLIDNDGADAVTGTFQGLAEGATLSLGGYAFRITYAGGTGNDVVVTYLPAASDSVGGAALQLVGGGTDDTLTGSDGNDTISALAGADLVRAGSGADVVYGNQGADTLWGNADGDTLYGGQGGDVAYGNQGGDVLYGNLGEDSLYGGQDADLTYGGQGGDLIYGNLGADRLHGNLGGDTLYGGGGADTLVGGAGDDWLAGNLGADRFEFDGDGGRDTIADFSAAEGDLIAVAAGLNGSGVSVASDLLSRLADDDSGNAVLDLGAGNTVTLIGVAATSLTAVDFVLT